MVHVRSDGLDGVEPHAMNQIEIAWCEGRRMRAELIAVGAAAAVMNDEPDVERFRLLGAFPGIAQQACLVCCRERRRLADVDVGRAKAKHRRDDRVDDVARRHDEQPHRTVAPLGDRHDV